MLSWAAAGCGNNAGFVLKTGDADNGSSAADAAPDQEKDQEQEQEADTQQAAEDVATDAEEISIGDIGPVAIGQTENAEAGTGCTVFISKDGMPAGLDVRGGGPARRGRFPRRCRIPASPRRWCGPPRWRRQAASGRPRGSPGWLPARRWWS